MKNAWITLALLIISAGTTACIVETGSVAPPSSTAPSPPKVDLYDLEGMKGAYLDSEMASRGFRNTGGYKQDDTAFTTWWNQSTRQCVSVATREGRVDRLESIAEGNCL